MDLPPGGIPPTDREGRYERAIAHHFKALGILLRAQIQVRSTAKPWPPNIKRANLLLAQAYGMLLDSGKELKDANPTAYYAAARSTAKD